MTVRALVLAVLLAPLPALAQDLPALYAVTGVASNDVLNLRERPEAKSPIVGALAPGAQGVEVVALSEDGRWGQVNAGESAGWAALSFLEPEADAPGWRDGAALNCFGTEPFWSLEVAAGGTAARYRGSDAGEGTWSEVLQRPGPSYPASLGLELAGDGFAAIRAEACSDGMSDHQFGLSILLFPDPAQESRGLAGCCSISP